MKRRCCICENDVIVDNSLRKDYRTLENNLEKISNLNKISEKIRQMTWEIDNKYNLHNKQYFHNTPYSSIHDTVNNIWKSMVDIIFCKEHGAIIQSDVFYLKKSLDVNKENIEKLKLIKSQYEKEDQIKYCMIVFGNYFNKELEKIIKQIEEFQEAKCLLDLTNKDKQSLL